MYIYAIELRRQHKMYIDIIIVHACNKYLQNRERGNELTMTFSCRFCRRRPVPNAVLAIVHERPFTCHAGMLECEHMDAACKVCDVDGERGRGALQNSLEQTK